LLTNNNIAMPKALLATFHSPWKMALYMLQRLPTLLFWGVRIQKVTEQEGVVTLPYGWRTQNPFRSIYFAAQCGAAEFSTGLLALTHLHGKGRVSMLITRMEADFVKKANSLVTFTCTDGELLRAAIEQAIQTGAPTTFTARSVGVQANGEIVAQLLFTWSFKAKT
jgi:hypothetical protein